MEGSNMTEHFLDITDTERVIAILLLFLTVIMQAAVLIITFHRRRSVLRYGANCLLFGASFLFLSLLASIHDTPELTQNLKTGELPYLMIIGITLLLSAHAVISFAMELRRRRTSLSVHSFKEAFDNLPCGVCFFNQRGIPLLCNRTMYRLSFTLSGRDIQHISEVEKMLKNPPEESGVVREGLVYRLLDGTVWHFADLVVTQSGHTQFTAFEVTELYARKQELLRDTEKLKEAAKNLRRYANNVQDATREQEILSMKMRIHEEMGSSLTAVSRVLSQKLPLEEVQPVISKWKDSVWMLKKENEPEEHGDYLTQLRQLCDSMKLHIITDGELPALDGANYLLVTALRVCATNAVRHAGATELYAKLSVEEDTATAVVTNNGTPPTSEIAESGGLSNLRRRVEIVGGKMTIKSEPRFELTVTVPLAREVYL
jgi:signal transduction histidine kinase